MNNRSTRDRFQFLFEKKAKNREGMNVVIFADIKFSISSIHPLHNSIIFTCLVTFPKVNTCYIVRKTKSNLSGNIIAG